MADEKKKPKLDDVNESVRRPIRPHDEEVVVHKMERPEAWPPPDDDSKNESDND